MGAQLNALIANRRASAYAPVKSYLQSRDQMQQQKVNQLAMQESRQNMKVKQMAMAKENEERKLEKVALYMKDVKDLQGYATARQELKVNEDIDSPETYAPDRVKSVVEHFYPETEKFETRTTDEGVSYQVSSLTGEEKKSPRTPTTTGMKGKHFSGQDIYKDSTGALFMGTGVGDPSTGAVSPSMVAVSGSGVKPQGSLRLVNTLGQTSGEVIDYKARLKSAEVRSKDDATFYTDYIPETRNVESFVTDIEMTQGLLDDLSEQTDHSSVGFGKFINKVPLTDAKYWGELKSTIQARLALSKMLDLKNASATGSTGFGQLSEKELKLLTDHLGSLEQAQSPEQIKKVSKQIYGSLENTKKGYKLKLLQNKKRFKTLHTEYYGSSREEPSLIRELPDDTQQQQAKETPNQNSKGWQLHTDAQGNKAYVSPDGKEFEEIQ